MAAKVAFWHALLPEVAFKAPGLCVRAKWGADFWLPVTADSVQAFVERCRARLEAEALVASIEAAPERVPFWSSQRAADPIHARCQSGVTGLGQDHQATGWIVTPEGKRIAPMCEACAAPVIAEYAEKLGEAWRWVSAVKVGFWSPVLPPVCFRRWGLSVLSSTGSPSRPVVREGLGEVWMYVYDVAETAVEEVPWSEVRLPVELEEGETIERLYRYRLVRFGPYPEQERIEAEFWAAGPCWRPVRRGETLGRLRLLDLSLAKGMEAAPGSRYLWHGGFFAWGPETWRAWMDSLVPLLAFGTWRCNCTTLERELEDVPRRCPVHDAEELGSPVWTQPTFDAFRLGLLPAGGAR